MRCLSCPAAVGISLYTSWSKLAKKVAAGVQKANRHGVGAEAGLVRS